MDGAAWFFSLSVFQRGIKARSTRALIALVNPDKPAYTDTRSALNATDEALELLCRLRRIPVGSLSDAQSGEFFFNALEDELGGGAYFGGRIQGSFLMPM